MKMYAISYFSTSISHNILERQRHDVHRRLGWLAVFLFGNCHGRKPDSLRSNGHESCFNLQTGRG
jgi:hypothetical protein